MDSHAAHGRVVSCSGLLLRRETLMSPRVGLVGSLECAPDLDVWEGPFRPSSTVDHPAKPSFHAARRWAREARGRQSRLE